MLSFIKQYTLCKRPAIQNTAVSIISQQAKISACLIRGYQLKAYDYANL